MSMTNTPVPSLAPGNYSRISRKSHVKPQHVGRVLKCLRGMSFDMACKIADGAGVSMDQLRAHIVWVREHQAKPTTLTPLRKVS